MVNHRTVFDDISSVLLEENLRKASSRMEKQVKEQKISCREWCSICLWGYGRDCGKDLVCVELNPESEQVLYIKICKIIDGKYVCGYIGVLLYGSW